MNALQHAKAEITQLCKVRANQQQVIEAQRERIRYYELIIEDMAMDDSNPDSQLLACLVLRRYPG